MDDQLIELSPSWSIWKSIVLRSAGLPVEFVERFAMPEINAMAPGVDRDKSAKARTEDAVREVLRSDLFLAAITWQNPALVESWVAGLAADPERKPLDLSRRRHQHERMIARYVQRYCMRNESIGFFGGVGWAWFADTSEPLTVDGDLGIRRRTVAFETWALGALAGAWAEDPRLAAHMPVRMDSAATIEGDTVLRPHHRSVRLDACALAIVAQLSSRPRYGELARRAADATALPTRELAARAAELRAGGIIRVGFTVPFDEAPERHLHRQIAEVRDPQVREELRQTLAGLEAHLHALAEVATDPAPLLGGLQRLRAGFVRAGGVRERSLGDNERGRTMAYLDCRRDLDAELGRPLLAELRRPLAILLDSAQWLAAEIGAAVAAELHDVYRSLRRRTGKVTLADLQLAAAHTLVPGTAVAEAPTRDFQLRWAEILPATSGAEITLCGTDIEPLVHALFPKQRPAWSAARQHSPDIMLYRHSDRYRWVLGELHVAMNTLESRVFRTQCDDPESLVRATAADFSRGRIVPVYPLDSPPSNSRTYPPPTLDPPGLYKYWSYTSDHGHSSGAQAIPATAIIVTERDGVLTGGVDGWYAPVIEFFGEFMTAICVNCFKLRPPLPYAPRTLIDDTVVSRATWQTPATAIPIPRSRGRDFTCQATREWAAERGIPRHVFVHTPGQRKPVYVDFEAPALVDNFAWLVRRAQESDDAVTVTEMLPNPDQLWLTDRSGQRYTAEFRMVAVSADPQPGVLTTS